MPERQKPGSQAHAFVEQLADIYDFVSPCFPPKYDMFRVIFRKYHEHMSFMLDCIGACAESLANADILKARGRSQSLRLILNSILAILPALSNFVHHPTCRVLVYFAATYRHL